MSGKASVLIWTGFHSAASAHGGDLRADQIATLCAEIGLDPEVIRMTVSVSAWRRWLRGLQGVYALRRRGIKTAWRSASLTGYTIAALEQVFRERPHARLLIWESVQNPLPALLARRFGLSLLALPHNVEAFDGTLDCLLPLRAEGIAMSWADHVTCIAEEDRWLWANLGIAADFLPYYPTPARREWLNAIAARRHENPPGSDAPWLILGTAHHGPTLQGMRAILRWIREIGASAGSVRIAGGGTEKLREEFESEQARCLGPVTPADLSDLLASSRGLIVHQEIGSGSLTRIPEALCAGLPVVASAIAARSTRGYRGISVYESIAEFAACLAQLPVTSTPRLAPPSDASLRFQARVRALAAAI